MYRSQMDVMFVQVCAEGTNPMDQEPLPSIICSHSSLSTVQSRSGAWEGLVCINILHCWDKFESAMACSVHGFGGLHSSLFLSRFHFCSHVNSVDSTRSCRGQYMLPLKPNSRDQGWRETMTRHTTKLYGFYSHKFLAVAPICFDQVTM